VIWVCRAGVNAIHHDYYVSTSKIYLPWDGFALDFSTAKTMDACKQIVIDEKHPSARTSVSNWAGQINAFCNEMEIGDHVLIPFMRSKKYTWARVIGEYSYDSNNEHHLWHSRAVEILAKEVPCDSFSQPLIYALGAYRTVFKVRKDLETQLLTILEENR